MKLFYQLHVVLLDFVLRIVVKNNSNRSALYTRAVGLQVKGHLTLAPLFQYSIETEIVLHNGYRYVIHLPLIKCHQYNSNGLFIETPNLQMSSRKCCL